MTAGGERNLQFRADPVGARDQHRRVHFARAVESDYRAEPPYTFEHVRALGRGRQPPEQVSLSLLLKSEYELAVITSVDT